MFISCYCEASAHSTRSSRRSGFLNRSKLHVGSVIAESEAETKCKKSYELISYHIVSRLILID